MVVVVVFKLVLVARVVVTMVAVVVVCPPQPTVMVVVLEVAVVNMMAVIVDVVGLRLDRCLGLVSCSLVFVGHRRLRRFRSVHVASFNKFSKSKTRRKENLPRTRDTCLESSSRRLGGVAHIEVGGKRVLTRRYGGGCGGGVGQRWW